MASMTQKHLNLGYAQKLSFIRFSTKYVWYILHEIVIIIFADFHQFSMKIFYLAYLEN
jgi:hypothetical protein